MPQDGPPSVALLASRKREAELEHRLRTVHYTLQRIAQGDDGHPAVSSLDALTKATAALAGRDEYLSLIHI